MPLYFAQTDFKLQQSDRQTPGWLLQQPSDPQAPAESRTGKSAAARPPQPHLTWGSVALLRCCMAHWSFAAFPLSACAHRGEGGSCIRQSHRSASFLFLSSLSDHPQRTHCSRQGIQTQAGPEEPPETRPGMSGSGYFPKGAGDGGGTITWSYPPLPHLPNPSSHNE